MVCIGLGQVAGGLDSVAAAVVLVLAEEFSRGSVVVGVRCVVYVRCVVGVRAVVGVRCVVGVRIGVPDLGESVCLVVGVGMAVVVGGVVCGS